MNAGLDLVPEHTQAVTLDRFKVEHVCGQTRQCFVVQVYTACQGFHSTDGVD